MQYLFLDYFSLSLSLIDKTCTAPVSKQKCKKYEIKWRFDSHKQECVRHWWGGCADTGNVFDSKEACITECKKTVVKTLVQSVRSKQGKMFCFLSMIFSIHIVISGYKFIFILNV